MIELAALLYSQFITYDRLTKIVNITCKDSNASMAHLYVDMNSLLRSTFSNIGNVQIGDYSVITSCMINMAIHYKSFFATRYQTACKVFFIYSDNYHEYNRKWVIGYNDKNYQLYHHSPVMTDILNQNIELMKILCPYINDVYFISTNQETGVMIQHLMNINKDTEKIEYVNFIISKDIYNFQLIYNPNTIILRPKKYYGPEQIQQSDRDVSYFVTRENIWQIILESRKIEYTKPILISPELVSLVLAVSGISSRNIKGTIGIKKAIETLEKLINDYSIPNSYSGYFDNNIIMIYLNSNKSRSKLLKDSVINTPEVVNMIGNFKAIDIAYQYDLFVNMSPEFDTVRSCLVNLYDPESLKKINEQYFKNNPLDFMRL